MPTIDIKQIEHLAELARLKVSDEEKEKMAGELSAILGFVEKLDQADVAGVLPTGNAAGIFNAMRQDAVDQYDKQKELVEAAPASKDNLVKVKAVFE
ncbi:MAG: Glutamyl-tRNA(Gln) amidotransferase subunit C [candidate division CPR1 bacterium GW2011_GWA2_42_17]|uniref:Aspartyl/glutamyl-tRNA(Asn/Gln) amidotransferase subunit C n=1 Tax=candidate division CPR1 bacterium GW2011_GWA2_42_17 TaxID=1618341 RepID=A0A0G0Z1S5_9BACT|nr:MAG: Glutamyl-tRNA(Gln) amidotransferase subunit C [candidate division CPR1 bacterium GW2011_GWA2_42_17]